MTRLSLLPASAPPPIPMGGGAGEGNDAAHRLASRTQRGAERACRLPVAGCGDAKRAHSDTLPPVFVSVGRSPLRVILLAVLSVPAVLLAVDMTLTHRLFPAPETTDVVLGTTINANGETVDVIEARLTEAGRREESRDRYFAALLGGAGAVTLAWALRAAMRPVKYLTADAGGIEVRIGRPSHPMVRIPWGDIDAVRSGLADDEGSEVQVVSIRFVDPVLVPVDPVGATTDPPWLHVYADDWEVPPHRVAPVLDAHAGRDRQVEPE